MITDASGDLLHADVGGLPDITAGLADLAGTMKRVDMTLPSGKDSSHAAPAT